MWNGNIKVLHWFEGAYECPLCKEDLVFEDNLRQHLGKRHSYRTYDIARHLSTKLKEELTKRSIRYTVVEGRIEFQREKTP